MNPKMAPQFLEHCGRAQCNHIQAYHIEAKGGYLTGRMVPCRADGCSCYKWVASWGVKLSG